MFRGVFMNIKKFASLLLCGIMMLSLFACGKGDNPDENSVVNNTTTSVVQSDGESTQVTKTSSATEADVKMPVDASYFDDAAFVGDSVSLKLSYYAMSTKLLGEAQFFTAGSLGANNALWSLDHPDSVHPSYRGEKMLVEDCIASSGVKKVYLMLGMNDLGLYGIDTTIESYTTLVSNILAKSPDVKIFIQSMTPMTDTSYIWGESLNNTVIGEYNQRLKTLCEEEGWGFVDVASVMYDDYGNLVRDYCSDPDDMGVHFTEMGCDVWINYLYNHA